MISKPALIVLLAAGCVTAAAGGAYVAVRQNVTDTAKPAEARQVASPAPLAGAESAQPTPVAATDAVVAPSTPAPAPAVEVEAPRTPSAKTAAPPPAQRTRKPAERQVTTADRNARSGSDQSPARTAPETATNRAEPLPPASPVRTDPLPEPVRLPEVAPATPEREFLELVVPSSSVIGLQVDTSLSSERARVEDRVEARVTRDVLIDGRVAIPAGTRVIGSVTVVERGGKIKERARLGVRFHTLVLADNLELPIRTESISREGQAPGRESSAKIGGAAVGGAILGAIIGGGKGAVIGGATGAAGGTAAVMAGDRNAATLTAGTVLTVRLTEPVTIEVEKSADTTGGR